MPDLVIYYQNYHIVGMIYSKRNSLLEVGLHINIDTCYLLKVSTIKPLKIILHSIRVILMWRVILRQYNLFDLK